MATITDIARKTTGTRTIAGTEFPIETVAQRHETPSGHVAWVLVRGLCNGVPYSSSGYDSRSELMDAFGEVTREDLAIVVLCGLPYAPLVFTSERANRYLCAETEAFREAKHLVNSAGHRSEDVGVLRLSALRANPALVNRAVPEWDGVAREMGL